MDIFAIVGIPFAVFLVVFALVGNAIGGSAAAPDDAAAPAAPASGRVRARRCVLLLAAAAVAACGAAAAATGAAFSRLTEASYAIEPAALLFTLEAAVAVGLAGVAALSGWSARRAWVLRTVGVYWLGVAGPALILADSGSGWISLTASGTAALPLGLSPFPVEVVAAVVPAILFWVASFGSSGTS
jgi:hypothetical protein